MHRVDHSTAKSVRPAIQPAGTPGYFGDGDASMGDPPTILTADYMNALQEELVAAVLAANLTLTKSTNSQLAQAITIIAGVQGAVVGSNTLSLNPTFPLPAYFGGHRVFAKIAADNTGPTTINVMGPSGYLGAKSIKTPDGQALKAGDLRAGNIALLFFDGADYRLMNGQRGATAAPGDSSDTLATTAFVTAAGVALLAAADAAADAGDAATLAAAKAYADAGDAATLSSALAAASNSNLFIWQRQGI